MRCPLAPGGGSFDGPPPGEVFAAGGGNVGEVFSADDGVLDNVLADGGLSSGGSIFGDGGEFFFILGSGT